MSEHVKIELVKQRLSLFTLSRIGKRVGALSKEQQSLLLSSLVCDLQAASPETLEYYLSKAEQEES